MTYEPTSVSFWAAHRTKESVSEYLEAHSDVFQCPLGQFLKETVPIEQKFQTEILKAVKKWAKDGLIDKNALFWKNGTGVYARSGLPDILGVIDGVFFAYEVKRPFIGGEPTDIQYKTINDINKAGGFASWGSYADGLKAIIIDAGLWKGEL